VKHLEENGQAVEIPLSGEDLAEITHILSKFRVSGARYNEAMARMVSAD
jgi:aryl-alcohol dehydrogenase-like predicted oxidoreductase